MLKFILEAADFEKLDEGHKSLYEADSAGRHVLQVDGAVPKSQLDEFRTNNVKLKKQVEAYGDITPEIAKELKDKKAEFEAGTDPKKIEELVNGKVAALKETHATEMATLQKDNQTLKAQRHQSLINAAITEAATKAGVEPSAIADVLARGSSVFSIGEDGESIQAVDASGAPVYGSDAQRLTPESWLGKLSKEAKHLFQPSGGGGANGPGKGGGGGNFSGGNPWLAGQTFSLTRQGELLRADRGKAIQMAAAAGVTIV